jgi:hypothetical protein
MRAVVFATAGTLVLAGGAILGQQTQPLPNQPTFAPFPAEVILLNEPTVQAQQSGRWEVRLADPVVLEIPTPEFLEVGGSYTFTWSGSDTAKTYEVLLLAGNGWVAAAPTTGGDALWLNTSLATSIEPQ